MAKLLLSFKGRKLKVFALQPGEYLIGRDPECTVLIDSLAVQPQHARVHVDDNACQIEPCDNECTITINARPLTESCTLAEGDAIGIGKHRLDFAEDSDSSPVQTEVAHLPAVGWLQIQSGSHLGRTIRLDKALTRVGRPDADLAVIAHRDEGYFLSALQGENSPLVNNQPIGDDSYPLNDSDQIVIGELEVQFFTDHQSGKVTAPSSGEKNEQRRFSRIPLDVKVTLKDAAHTWETDLLDISLHGALVKVPETFEANAEQRYQLAVHLEGGPDICMDVEIAHQEAHELGLNCHDIDVDSITHLRRLVELNLGDPELLERELSALG
jgi:pSer/pThr/pTyr-binding forkhead associated (FHA) protein